MRCDSSTAVVQGRTGAEAGAALETCRSGSVGDVSQDTAMAKEPTLAVSSAARPPLLLATFWKASVAAFLAGPGRLLMA